MPADNLVESTNLFNRRGTMERTVKPTWLWILFDQCRSACLLCGAVAIFSLLSAGVARSQSTGETKEATKESISQRGFVFVDGEYLPPPYVIKEAGSSVEINGHAVQMAASATRTANARQIDSHRGPWRGGRFDRRGMRMNAHRWGAPEPPELDQATYVANYLSLNAILVVEAEEEISFLCHERQIYEFLTRLLEAEKGDHSLHHVFKPAVTASQRVSAYDFSPSPSLVERARKVIAEIDGLAADGLAAEKGIRRLSMFAFPLTIAGMLLSCLASGHLISYPPRPLGPDADASVRMISQRATVICLALLIALSGLDLAWTLLASQAGQMVELNPLGSRMVDDPYSLVAFKISITLASCGILFAFRRRHSARLASWWLCMALTLLTCRWLVFNSMQAA